MASSRRKAREVALQALYEIEIGHGRATEAVEGIAEDILLGSDLAAYALSLTEGIRKNLAEIDGAINPCLRDYDIQRTHAVDRNILRIAAYEILFLEDMPPAVSINEAIEIAKKYSTAESGKFINGVLGTFLKSTPKANWVPSESTKPEEIEEVFVADEPMEVEEIEVEAGSPQEANVRKLGGWTLRSEF